MRFLTAEMTKTSTSKNHLKHKLVAKGIHASQNQNELLRGSQGFRALPASLLASTADFFCGHKRRFRNASALKLWFLFNKFKYSVQNTC